MNLFSKKFRFKRLDLRGQAIVELALILPLLLVIVFGTVEYSHMFMTALRASNLSREIANTAFRDCAFVGDLAMKGCLTTNVERVRNEGNVVLPDFSAQGMVIASAYEQDIGSSPPVRLIAQRTGGSGDFTSRYDVNGVDPELLAKHERIVIGEILYPYTPVTPIKSFLTLLNVRTVIYEVTIY